MTISPWRPCKIHLHADGREVLFVQHVRTRIIRKTHSDVLERMDAAQRDALPSYHENPKYIVRGAPGDSQVFRWPQVADVVHCGELVFGECIEEARVQGGLSEMRVLHRDGSEALYPLEMLEVIHHNIEGMGYEIMKVL